MKRRSFIKAAALGTAAVAMRWDSALFAQSDEKNEEKKSTESSAKPLDIVAVYGGTAVEMFEKGIAEMGGMGRFVKKGQSVVLKPNIGWDRTPEYGANTDPDLMGVVTRYCLEAGAKEVICFDRTCGNDWENRYKMSGIQEAVEKNGGKMITGHNESLFEEQEIPKGVKLKKAKVHKLLLSADVCINMPVLKHHGGTKITAALKNSMGCIWDRGFWHSNDLPQCIADFSTYWKTQLTILDAYRVMLENGPRGSNPDRAPIAKYQIISTDMVAADTAATQIFAQVARQHNMGRPYTLDEITYLALAEKAGVGTMDLTKLNMKRVAMA
ncbi:MAG TPA: DUF362 domain-containing protein [Verrucomicrobiota bacterium]|nr:DUF362 domain-containing protein [Verrucomicrobiota bacterium]